LEFSFEIKDDLFGVDFGRTLNAHLHKRPSSECNSNPLRKGSLRKCPYSHVGHWEVFRDGITSDAIEGEASHVAIPIFYPSMPTTDISFEPISKPILDLDDSFYALSPESRDDPRNLIRHLKHRNHEGSKEDQEEQ
jgi:hypothetical protein